MKIAAITPVYNEEKLISACVKCWEKYVDQHIVLVSEKPYYGEGVADNTADIAEELGADVIRGTWSLDHEQRNLGLKILKDYDWVLCIDSDEFITSDHFEMLYNNLVKAKASAYTVNHYPYWKDTNHVIKDTFQPLFATKPNNRFSHIRNINAPFSHMDDVFIHHLSWCEPKDILKKISTYAHADEFNPELWYNTHYANWKEGEMAVFPRESFPIEKRALPEEIKRLLV
jgi:glycosyltransferase involved in cell wall biosynthesis